MANDLDFKIFIRAEADSTAIQAVTRDLAKQSQTAMEAQQAQMRAAAEQQRIAREDSERFSREQRERENASKAFLASLEDKQKALDLARAEEAKRHEQFMREVEAEGKALAEAAAAEALRQKAIDRATAGARNVLGRSREVMDAPPPPVVAKGQSEMMGSLMADMQRVGNEYAALNTQQEKAAKSGFGMADVFKALAGGSLPELAARLGIAGTAVFALHKAWQTVLGTDEELNKSWSTMADTLSKTVGGAINEVINSGGGLKGVFDSITTALGGQTAEMKDSLGPMTDYVAIGKEVLSTSDAIAQSLKSQAEAAKQNSEAFKVIEEAQRSQQRAAEDAALERDKARINADASLSPEDKQQQLADIEAQRRMLDEGRAQQDAAAPRDEAMRKLQLADEEKARADAALAQQEARVKAHNQNAMLARQEKSLKEAAEFQRSQIREDQYVSSGTGGATFVPGTSAAERAAIEKRVAATEERLAKVRQQREAINPDLLRGFGDPEEEKKALETARKAAEEAAREVESAERAATAADASATASENIAAIKAETQAYVQAQKEAEKRAAEAAGADVSEVPQAVLQSAPAPRLQRPPATPEEDAAPRNERLARRERRARGRYRAIDESAQGGQESRSSRGGQGVGGGVFIAPQGVNSGSGFPMSSGGSDPTEGPALGVMKNGVAIGEGRQGQTGIFSPSSPHMAPLRGASEAILQSNAEMVNMIGSLAGHMEKAVTAVRTGLDRHLQTIRGATMDIAENRRKTAQTMRMVGRVISEQDV